MRSRDGNFDKRGTAKKKVERKNRTDGHGNLKKDWRKIRGMYWLEDGRK